VTFNPIGRAKAKFRKTKKNVFKDSDMGCPRGKYPFKDMQHEKDEMAHGFECAER